MEEKISLPMLLGFGYALLIYGYPILADILLKVSRVNIQALRAIYIFLIFAPILIIPLIRIKPKLLTKSDEYRTFLTFYSISSLISSAIPIAQIYWTSITDLSYIISTIRGVFIASVFTAIERYILYLRNQRK